MTIKLGEIACPECSKMHKADDLELKVVAGSDPNMQKLPSHQPRRQMELPLSVEMA